MLLLQEKKGKKTKAEEEVTKINQQMAIEKMRGSILTSIIVVAIISILGGIYENTPVARLPFDPFSLLQSLTHRGLLGTDMNECSYMFIFILSTMYFRQNIQKACGFSPSRAEAKYGSMPMDFGKDK